MKKLTQEEKDRVAEILERVNKTRPGSWKFSKEGRDHESGSDFIMTGVGVERGDDLEIVGATEDDMEFIGESKQDILFLLWLLTEKDTPEVPSKSIANAIMVLIGYVIVTCIIGAFISFGGIWWAISLSYILATIGVAMYSIQKVEEYEKENKK